MKSQWDKGVLRIMVSNEAIVLSGPDIVDLDPAVLHVLPGAVDVARTGKGVHISLEPINCASRDRLARWAEVPLIAGTDEVRLGDAIYGLARFVQAEHLAQQGILLADAGALCIGDGLEVRTAVVLGAGKSTFAVRAARAGHEVVADDVVQLQQLDGAVRVTGRLGGLIHSRSGLAANLGEDRTRHGTAAGTVVVQSSYRGRSCLQAVSQVDLSSWWWQALAGRTVNIRSFPRCFASPYLRAPTKRAQLALAEVYRALVTMPSVLVLGDVDDASIRRVARGDGWVR